MINLNQVQSQYQEDLDSVVNWCKEAYSQNFESYFVHERELFDRMKSRSHPITDEELEYILTELPLQLFSVAEQLNQFILNQQVIKLSMKIKKDKLIKESDAKTLSDKKESADVALIGDTLLVSAFDSVVNRVEKEISYSRELIMGAKKIWDSRRSSEVSNPVGEVTLPDTVDDLPEYTPNK